MSKHILLIALLLAAFQSSQATAGAHTKESNPWTHAKVGDLVLHKDEPYRIVEIDEASDDLKAVSLVTRSSACFIEKKDAIPPASKAQNTKLQLNSRVLFVTPIFVSNRAS